MHSHDANTSILSKPHVYAPNPDKTHDNESAFVYQEIEDGYKHAEYPKHMYALDEAGKLYSVYAESPEKEPEGKFFDSPTEALESVKKPKKAEKAAE